MADEIELRHLRYFLAVAETENFTRAAERCGVSQPAISQQMQLLEQALGVLLLSRAGRRVRLTEAGRTFAERARLVLRRMDEARDAVGAVREAFVGHVEAAAIPSMLMGFAPRALQRLSRTHPGLTVHVQERPSHEIETEVESGRCELGLGILSRLSINLAYETLATGPLCAVVPSGHLLRSATSLAPGDLALERVVLHPQGYDMRHIADAWFAREGQRAKVACELSTIESLLAVVRGACMPTLLPRIALEGRDAADLALVPLEGADPIEFGLILPRGSPLAPAADALLSALRDTSANHEGRGST